MLDDGRIVEEAYRRIDIRAGGQVVNLNVKMAFAGDTYFCLHTGVKSAASGVCLLAIVNLVVHNCFQRLNARTTAACDK